MPWVDTVPASADEPSTTERMEQVDRDNREWLRSSGFMGEGVYRFAGADVLVSEGEMVEQLRQSSEAQLRSLMLSLRSSTTNLERFFQETPPGSPMDRDFHRRFLHAISADVTDAALAAVQRLMDEKPMETTRMFLRRLSPRERRELWSDFGFPDGRR